MYVWRYLDERGLGAGSSAPFPGRTEAEAWLREAWSDLLDQGVQEVALTDDAGDCLYRMGLGDPPD